MNEESETNDKDLIFNNDPLYMLSLIGKNIKVELVDKQVYIGRVYVVDPVFKNVIIHEKISSEVHFLTRMILHHAIKSLTVLPEARLDSYVTDKSQKEENNTDVMSQKLLLKEWLKHMCLQVEESGDCLKIDDNLVIVPPYGPENCICNNTLILERIQNIILSMPCTLNS